MPPLARLSQLCAGDDVAQERLGQILRIADMFVGLLGQESFRTEAGGITSTADMDKDSRIPQVLKWADELNEALQALFFDSQPLASRARSLLSF